MKCNAFKDTYSILRVDRDAVSMLLQFFNYPLTAPEFDRTVGTCYYKLSGGPRDVDDDE